MIDSRVSRIRALAACLAAATGLCGAPGADAGFRRGLHEDLSKGFVVAESRHGNGVISGAVRRARYGWEVRLPRGTWVGCRRSCSETLRVETVDFWEGHPGVGGGAFAHECGIFGCLEIRFPR